MSDLSGQSIGRYTILEKVGQGGMAAVYLGRDQRLNRLVAIKLLHPGHLQSERFLRRFAIEVQTLARLSHPHIIKIFDSGEFEDRPYLVMEYLPGGTLKDRMVGPIPWYEAALLLAPIARALEYSHQNDIIHRDIKPSNILLQADGSPVLSDFGIAKRLSSEETLELTGTGVGLGTPEYMAPEQGMGKDLDGRADIYSLGVVYFELVTGRKPFQADTPMAVLYLQMSTVPVKPGALVTGLPEKVEKVILRTLARQAEGRYRNAGALALELEGLGEQARRQRDAEERVRLDAAERVKLAEEKKRESLRRKQEEEARHKAWLEAEERARLQAAENARHAEEKKQKEAVLRREEEEARQKARQEIKQRARQQTAEKSILEAEQRERKAQRQKEEEQTTREQIAAIKRSRKQAAERALLAENKKARDVAMLRQRQEEWQAILVKVARYKTWLAGGVTLVLLAAVYIYGGGKSLLLEFINGPTPGVQFGINLPTIKLSTDMVINRELQFTSGSTPSQTVVLATDALIPHTSTPAATITPTKQPVYSRFREKDGMVEVFVPAGIFTMGSDDGERSEAPLHEVYLDPYWIDQLEVTNAMYERCVVDGSCSKPASYGYSARKSAEPDSRFFGYPITDVTWKQASGYCVWAGGSLPTEAQWEKAARGIDGRSFPWGEEASCDKANLGGCGGKTTLAGTYPEGSSPYGALDMSGNVWEWVLDWFDWNYYGVSPDRNPEGPSARTQKAMRGGSWYGSEHTSRVTSRGSNQPDMVYNYIGFRCVRSEAGTIQVTTEPADLLTITPDPDGKLVSGLVVNRVREKDEMVEIFIPAGTFTLGMDSEDAMIECQKYRDDCQKGWFTDEMPVHTVSLSSYWIDQTEVTNSMYAQCVAGGVCTKPASIESSTQPSYYGYFQYNDYPVMFVNWTQASSYCKWAGGRLPSEAEWEKAARGTGWIMYPWGNEFDGNTANFCDKNCLLKENIHEYDDGFPDTAPVGSYPEGKSPYGVLDMAGNLWEWTSSLVMEYPYDADDGREEHNSSQDRVLRGGSWFNLPYNMRVSYRGGAKPTISNSSLGFRCVRQE